MSHTHYNAEWETVDSNGHATMHAIRDGSQYAITQHGGLSLSIRAKGGHAQICDTSTCQFVDNSNNVDFALQGVNLDPAYALKLVINDPVSEAGDPAYGEATTCLSGPDPLEADGAQRKSCYLSETNLLVSSESTGADGRVVESTHITSLSAGIPSHAFDDMRGPMRD